MFLFAVSIAMFACSENDDVVPPVVEPRAAITFDISAVSQVAGNTRGPVYSQEATQHVTRVSVYAFMNDGTGVYKFKKMYTLPGWNDGMTFMRYEVADADKVAVGDYKFLGVGRDASDMFTVTSPTVDVTTFDSMMASVAASGNETEIFAGIAPGTVTAEGGSRVSIAMKRQVAGILGYFKNIPQMINGTTVRYLRLSVSNSNQMVNLTNGVGINSAPAAYNIINLDLSTQGVTNGLYNGNDLSGQGVATVPMSQLGGSFLIPVGGVTMTLGLYDTAGVPIKTWTVLDGLATNMSIMANHFYSLGVKKMAANTNGGTGLPGDADAPIDLLYDQNIVITIYPAWDLIHNLVVQPIVPV